MTTAEKTEQEVKNAQAASEITERIRHLNELSGEDLVNEMAALKQALMENPAACALLLPEDVGLAVQAIKVITGKALVEASTKKTTTRAKKEPVKKMSAEELQAALDDPDF